MVSDTARPTEPLPDFDRMKDHDLLVTVATSQHYMKEDIVKIEKHQEETNGTVASLVLKAARVDGAMWVLGILMVVGIAVAGVVVVLVA